MGGLVAGVDCSTQQTKVVVVDAEDGRILASGRAPHRITGAAGVREADPEHWWEALGAALAQTGRASDVAAIAVSGQQHALVLLDAAGRPLRLAPLWNDTTSAADALGLVEAHGGRTAWVRSVGSVPTTSFSVAKWARLRRLEPTVLAATAAIRLPHDFLTERLCGRGVTDRGDASGTGWWSPTAGAYAADVLALEQVDLDPVLLPEVLTGSEAAGIVRDGRGAAALGLANDVLVAAGTGDNMAAAIGLGLAPGTPVVSLGTSGTVFVVADRPAGDPSGLIAGFADAGRRFLPLACTLNATLAIDRVAAWLGLDREDVAPAGEVAMLPYLDGERAPYYPRAAGTIVGLRHDTRGQQILQAAYDGAVEGLMAALDRLATVTGGVDPTAPLVLVGGGARGEAWRATVSRLSGRRLELPVEPELVAVGAAALAAASLSGGDAATIARRWAAARAPTEIEATVRDVDRLTRLRTVREQLTALNAGGPPRLI